MQSLLRTRPENLDDLTVQVALVRPGPDPGQGRPPLHRAPRSASARTRASSTRSSTSRCASRSRETLGVVVFQDQVLDVAMAAARFSVGEAEGLRRAMSRKRSEEAIEAFRPRFVEGCLGNGIDEATAHAIYDKLVGFSGFGFPKSHAAAFGLLAYQSAWLRRYYPAEFLCSLLNAQPMGFYPPASLVRDAQRRGVEVRPPHVNLSGARCTVEDGRACGSASATSARSARRRPRRSPPSSPTRTSPTSPAAPSVGKDALEALVASGACDDWGPRRELLWRLGVTARGESAGDGNRQLALPLGRPPRPRSSARRPTGSRCSPTTATPRSRSACTRSPSCARALPHGACVASNELHDVPHGARIEVAGLAVARQRPSTANGIVFMLLEDEHGQMNLIIPPPVYEAHRAIVRGEPLLLARGRFERVGRNENVLVDELESLGPLARRAAGDAEVRAALPGAHHFGHR